ncbi:MAG: hypothetical protein AB1491_10430 [Thermodesulfobacteriota bacterium]
MEKDAAAEMAERLRPLVNDILERFNQQGVTPKEAGTVILALTQRLMAVLEENPEDRRHFVLDFINLVNAYLAGEAGED